MPENLPVLVPPVTIGSESGAGSGAENPLHSPDRGRRIRRMMMLARLMDSAFKIPGTNYTIGIDPLIGLIPVLGDIITTSVSLFIMYDAIKLGATPSQVLRMTANICIDFLIGEIVVVGDVFDFAWKANMRNLAVMGLTPLPETPPTAPPSTSNT